MKYIKLKSGERVLVDNIDFPYLSKYKWHIVKQRRGRYCYAIRREQETKKIIFMHRQILKTPKGVQVDHINHNTLNNCRRNIRNCFGNENAQNRVAQKCKSKCQGVRKHQSGKWEARIQRDSINYYLGHFMQKCKAVQAYKQVKQYWAEKVPVKI